MRSRFQLKRSAPLMVTAGALALAMGMLGRGVAAQGGQAAAPNYQAQAAIDLTGNWVSVVTEDWRWRMVTPPKGDFASIPLNAEGRRVGDLWDPDKDTSEGNACKSYGAMAIMRVPGRLQISWQDNGTLKIATDAGQQTRLIHFVQDLDTPRPAVTEAPAGAPTAGFPAPPPPGAARSATPPPLAVLARAPISGLAFPDDSGIGANKPCGAAVGSVSPPPRAAAFASMARPAGALGS